MKTRCLITVKAYPVISKKYGETVCTAAITDEGKWIRIYPIPFRKLDYPKRFRKYDWVVLDLIRNTKDFRPETYRPAHLEDIIPIGHIPTGGGAWLERRKAILDKAKVYTNLDELIAEAKNKEICTSLAIFKPTAILNFTWKPVEREWDSTKLRLLESSNLQCRLFEQEDVDDISEFEVVDKVPYKFSFTFTDDSGRESTMMIEDWETGMLYWNSLRRHEGNEAKACEDVKKKYFDDFARTKDYYFFLGTTQIHHYQARNPFVIIGDFRPKFIAPQPLDLFQ